MQPLEGTSLRPEASLLPPQDPLLRRSKPLNRRESCKACPFDALVRIATKERAVKEQERAAQHAATATERLCSARGSTTTRAARRVTAAACISHTSRHSTPQAGAVRGLRAGRGGALPGMPMAACAVRSCRASARRNPPAAAALLAFALEPATRNDLEAEGGGARRTLVGSALAQQCSRAGCSTGSLDSQLDASEFRCGIYLSRVVCLVRLCYI